ncbi:hypothetical protein MOMA_00295 [Moraxella macacae 0408225]|uniref:Uncharacterized protein n=1 Tax=Moraxella macacae 0408225 TaxID=1230338 RepID=L2F7C4_9GAMM|nr:hypothetical protein MOMA_00295 [Moraxella macacae 0408225]
MLCYIVLCYILLYCSLFHFTKPKTQKLKLKWRLFLKMQAIYLDFVWLFINMLYLTDYQAKFSLVLT